MLITSAQAARPSPSWRNEGRCHRRRRHDRGSTVIVGAIATAMLLLVFAGAANVVLDEYAKGALRTAVDEAAHVGATTGGPGAIEACLGESATVRANLLRGPFGSRVVVACRVEGELVVATATGSLPSLLPALPRLSVTVSGVAVMREVPAQ
jgi:hypothetical protein